MKKSSLLLLGTTTALCATSVYAANVVTDDQIVIGSMCVGIDCQNGENFSFDTIRLKENNLRIKFQDTSSAGSFPSNDWQITINDSANGGMSYFQVEDITAGTKPFTLRAGAPNHSLYVTPSGKVGIGTDNPATKVDLKDGNSPTLRLQQDESSGFAAQSWDVGGNETNFFVRDVTNGSRLPFRIVTGAPNASLFVAADGDVGFKTTTPDGVLDVAHPANLNDHAFFISPTGDVGINVSNGFIPNSLFDIQKGDGKSIFQVDEEGLSLNEWWDIQGESRGDLTIQSRNARIQTKIELQKNGTLVIQGARSANRIELKNDGTILIGDGITVDDQGDVTVTNLTITGTCTGCLPQDNTDMADAGPDPSP